MLCLVCLHLAAWAEMVTGTIIDAETGEVLIGATVVAEEPALNAKQGKHLLGGVDKLHWNLGYAYANRDLPIANVSLFTSKLTAHSKSNKSPAATTRPHHTAHRRL